MKKLVRVAAISASILALGASANAAVVEMNIFGASAQGQFWNTYAGTFLKDNYGCTSTQSGYVTGDANRGVTRGKTCTKNGGEDVIISYTSNKSVEGPRAVVNTQPTADVDTCAAVNGVYKNRLVATMDAAGAITTACKDINVGASDVASESFTQASQGKENGYMQTGAAIDVNLGTQVIPGAADISIVRNPIIVPFSFFANTDLPTNNITRQQALLLFSGNVASWSQFGPGYPEAGVALCMRHAGSGTHATLDKAIMRGDAVLSSVEDTGIATVLPAVLFHESSTDLSKCVNANGGSIIGVPGEYVAIGYADSDKIVSALTTTGEETKGSSYTKVKRLKYNGIGEGMTAANYAAYGYSALKNEIKNGSYEFWASQYMYMDGSEPTPVKNLFNAMMTFAETNPIECNPADPKKKVGCYWMNQGELSVVKESDTTVPHF